MAKSTHKLLIGSTEAYTGKSATILGIAPYLKEKGLSLAYCKPIGAISSSNSSQIVEDDISYIAKTLELSPEQIGSPILYLDDLTIISRLSGETATGYSQFLKEYVRQTTADLVARKPFWPLSRANSYSCRCCCIVSCSLSFLIVSR